MIGIGSNSKEERIDATVRFACGKASRERGVGMPWLAPWDDSSTQGVEDCQGDRFVDREFHGGPGGVPLKSASLETELNAKGASNPQVIPDQ